MTKITLSDGFEVEVDEGFQDDMELLDDMVALQEGDATRIPAMIGRVLSADEKKRLYDHLRGENGRVPVAAFTVTFMEIINAFSEGKK